MREVERGLDGPLLWTDALYYLFIMALCLMHARRGPYLGIDFTEAGPTLRSILLDEGPKVPSLD